MQYKPISLHYKQKHITMKKQMKQIALPLFLGGLIACSPKTAVNETDLLGNWTEILPPSSNFVQGMTLAKEGKASSIGMATLQTAHSERKKHWKRTDNFILRYTGYPVFTTRHSHSSERGRLSDKICTPAGISTFSWNRQGFYGIHLVGRITKRHPDF